MNTDSQNATYGDATEPSAVVRASRTISLWLLVAALVHPFAPLLIAVSTASVVVLTAFVTARAQARRRSGHAVWRPNRIIEATVVVLFMILVGTLVVFSLGTLQMVASPALRLQFRVTYTGDYSCKGRCDTWVGSDLVAMEPDPARTQTLTSAQIAQYRTRLVTELVAAGFRESPGQAGKTLLVRSRTLHTDVPRIDPTGTWHLPLPRELYPTPARIFTAPLRTSSTKPEPAVPPRARRVLVELFASDDSKVRLAYPDFAVTGTTPGTSDVHLANHRAERDVPIGGSSDGRRSSIDVDIAAWWARSSVTTKFTGMSFEAGVITVAFGLFLWAWRSLLKVVGAVAKKGVGRLAVRLRPRRETSAYVWSLLDGTTFHVRDCPSLRPDAKIVRLRREAAVADERKPCGRCHP